MKTSHLSQLCRQLQLSGVAATIDQACEQSARQKQSHQEFLLDLFQQESAYRNQRRAQRRVKEGKFPIVKTLDSFDFQRATHLPEVQLRTLAEGDYIRQAESIIFMGEPGTGKTHLGLCVRLCCGTTRTCRAFYDGQSTGEFTGRSQRQPSFICNNSTFFSI